MSKQKISFTQLTHDVVQQSPEPLPFDEILKQVNAIHTITTKNPKNTIRNAISQSHMIVSTGDGRFGWKPRLVNGAVVRHTLSEAELAESVLHWDVDVWDLLWPTFFAKHKYNDRSPAKVALPNETVSEMPLVHYGHTVWGSQATPAFWIWLKSQHPQTGDHLLFRGIDGEERWYAVTFAARAARSEAVIQERNQAMIALGQKMMKRPYGAMEYDITTHALATGFYQDEAPPQIPLANCGKPSPGLTKKQKDMPFLKTNRIRSSVPCLSDRHRCMTRMHRPACHGSTTPNTAGIMPGHLARPARGA